MTAATEHDASAVSVPGCWSLVEEHGQGYRDRTDDHRERDAHPHEVEEPVRTLDSLVDEEDYDTWAPLVEDTTDDVEIAYARLRRVMDPACADRTDNNESAADAADQEDFAWTAY